MHIHIYTQGRTIKYEDFVIAVDTIGSRHPLQMSHGRSIPVVL